MHNYTLSEQDTNDIHGGSNELPILLVLCALVDKPPLGFGPQCAGLNLGLLFDAEAFEE